MNKIKHFHPFLLIFPLLFIGCSEEEFTPKPRGFFRIALPVTEFSLYQSQCPFVFEVSKNAQINPYTKQNKPCWFDIRYHNLKATVHCSYDNIKGKNNQDYFEDARDLAYKHVVKSSGIKEYSITDFEQKVYGIIYEISGNTASSYQFYLTDSVNHFFRASLYYDDQVNLDSIAPVTDFLKKDINRITETFRWK